MLHGEAGDEVYSLTPFRAADDWAPGLYLAVGSFYNTTGRWFQGSNFDPRIAATGRGDAKQIQFS